MLDIDERHVRGLVAEQLGVDPTELTANVSLTDELAVDSLELAALALTLEAELGVVFSNRCLGGLRTYGDLLEAIAVARRARRGHGLGRSELAVYVRLERDDGAPLRSSARHRRAS
jgi:acyl carrier protein